MVAIQNLKAIRSHFLRGANILRKLFMTQAMSKGVKIEGNSLNGMALTRSFISARSCRENNDRYITQVRKPKTRCAFSFAMDFSGSMTSRPTKKDDTFLGNSSSWERVIGSIHAITNVAESIGIKSKIGFVQFDSREFEIGILKDFEQKAWSDEYAQQITRLSPFSGTDISFYARASIYMLENIEADHKIAFFLTDGEDWQFEQYAYSLNELAKSKNITLVGIAFTQNPKVDHLPNGVFCTDTKQLGDIIFKHLEKTLK